MSLVVAIIGAESTGKSTLAVALGRRIAELSELRCTSVPEHLRQWCQTQGRTPRADEQASIARRQVADIDAAAASHDLVVADTTPLMIAVYSLMLFNDASLVDEAVRFQRRCSATLLTALDLPWVPDGLQRDGPQVRVPVDGLLRQLLLEHRLPWSVIGGAGPARLDSAIDALAPLLRPLAGSPGSGLFTRLEQRNAEPSARRWQCALCDDAQCEHLSLQQRRG